MEKYSLRYLVSKNIEAYWFLASFNFHPHVHLCLKMAICETTGTSYLHVGLYLILFDFDVKSWSWSSILSTFTSDINDNFKKE